MKHLFKQIMLFCFVFFCLNAKAVKIQILCPHCHQQSVIDLTLDEELAKLLTKELAEKYDGKSEDEKLVLKYVSDNLLISKNKEEGIKKVSVWEDYEKYQKKLYGEKNYLKSFPIHSLKIEYDEVWIYKRTEFLSKKEITENAETLQRWTFYFKNKILQAHTVENFFYDSPLSKNVQKNITTNSPRYKITCIQDRDLFIKSNQ
jgi:hypothetical protein